MMSLHVAHVYSKNRETVRGFQINGVPPARDSAITLDPYSSSNQPQPHQTTHFNEMYMIATNQGNLNIKHVTHYNHYNADVDEFTFMLQN